MSRRSGRVASPKEFAKLGEMLQRCDLSALPLLATLKSGDLLDGGSTMTFWVDDVDNPKICAKVMDLSQSSSDSEHYTHVTCANICEVTEEEIRHFLAQSGAVDWTKGTLFPALNVKWKDVIKSLAEDHEGRCGHEGASYVYRLPLDSEALTRHPSDLLSSEYSLGPLQEKHAERINAMWKFGAGQRTLDYIRRRVACANRVDGTCGVFYCKDGSRSDGSDEELVSWGLMQSYGGIGLVQTVDEHRRRGLASAVVLYLAKWCAERQQIPFCYVEVKNSASLRTFERLGFERAEDFRVMWVFFWPRGSAFQHSGVDESCSTIPGVCT